MTGGSSPVILMTGASRGLGRATALELARSGAHVVLLARTVKDLEAVDDQIQEETGQPATLVPVDLKESKALYELADQLLQKFGRLDALIGCAAVLGNLSPLTHLDAKTVYEVMEVNCLANFHLLRALTPLLEQSSHPQVIFATSARIQESQAFWGAYNMSKAALEAMVQTYANEHKNSKIKVSLFDPGVMGTALHAKAFPGIKLETLPSPKDAAQRLVRQFFTTALAA